MSAIDILEISDLALTTATADAVVKQVGFSSAGEIERFISVWARALAKTPLHQRPDGTVFRLLPPSVPGTPIDEGAISSLPVSLVDARTKGVLIEVNAAAGPIAQIPLVQSVKAQLQSGLWHPGIASQLSHSMSDACVIYVAGRECLVFAKGTEAIGYDDVIDRKPRSAYDASRRQPWGDGELLCRCASEKLQERGRRGIWQIPELFLLQNSPEELIEHILSEFLEGNLRGFQEIVRQHVVPAEGRLDVLVILADGMRYVVELKWIGRAARAGIDYDDDAVRKQLMTKWSCRHAFVLGEDSAYAGVLQMTHYYRRLRPARVYLVAYDCRWAHEQKGEECARLYPVPPNLSPGQYRVLHVGVDPRTASVKGKAALAAKRKSKAPGKRKKS